MKQTILIISTLLLISCGGYNSPDSLIESCARAKAKSEGMSYADAYDECEGEYYDSKIRR